VIRILDLYSYVQEKVVADQPNQRPVLKVEVEENYPIVIYRGGKPPETGPIERPEDGFKYDVFLSYRGQDPDRTWVRKTLYPRLKAEGLKVCLDAVDFRLGELVIHEMERAVKESRSGRHGCRGRVRLGRILQASDRRSPISRIVIASDARTARFQNPSNLRPRN
jgi:hypothetical protein